MDSSRSEQSSQPASRIYTHTSTVLLLSVLTAFRRCFARRCRRCHKGCLRCVKACKDASKEKRRENLELCFVLFVMVALVSGMLAFFATVMA